MRLTLDGQCLRLRIDETELARLTGGEAVTMRTRHAGGEHRLRLELAEGASASLVWSATTMAFVLPRQAVLDYATTLPRRDGLALALAQDLTVELEVDVRDSLRRRGPRRG